MQASQVEAQVAFEREREELLRVKEALSFERDEFRRYRETSEAKLKRLRQEASRAEDLEDELAKKHVKLKQKEAEARLLASDAEVVRDLRQSLSSKVRASGCDLCDLRHFCDGLEV